MIEATRVLFYSELRPCSNSFLARVNGRRVNEGV